jgi:hypothetical protein
MDNTTRALMSQDRKAQIRRESIEIISWLEKLMDFQTAAKEADEGTALYDAAITNNTARLTVLAAEIQSDLDFRDELRKNVVSS